ncbi:MAG: nicotinate-nucleotide adenylyltransferase [Candidatus Omnitrophota bacterium]|jgi:nicotinate-nucleotide adenylyltransferase
MRIGVYGGSFDPVHSGHIKLIRAAQKALKLNMIIIMPTSQNPLKKQAANASANQRLSMARLAFGGIKDVKICGYEAKRKPPAFSINSIKYLRKRWGQKAEYYFIAGSDVISQWPKWKSIDELMSLCSFTIAYRKGQEVVVKPKHAKYAHLSFQMQPDEASSTVIKKQLKSNTICPKSLDPKVFNYIKINKLYSCKGSYEKK